MAAPSPASDNCELQVCARTAHQVLCCARFSSTVAWGVTAAETHIFSEPTLPTSACTAATCTALRFSLPQGLSLPDHSSHGYQRGDLGLQIDFSGRVSMFKLAHPGEGGMLESPRKQAQKRLAVHNGACLSSWYVLDPPSKPDSD